MKFPECPRMDCRFQEGPRSSTGLYFPPLYDKYGNNLNPDGNSTFYSLRCTTCGKTWDAKTRFGETTFTEAA